MKKRYYIIPPVIIAATIIELDILLPVSLFAYSFSMVFILVIILAFILSLEEAIIWAIMQGLLLDLMSPSPFGIYMVACTVLVIFIKFMQHTWFKQSSILSVMVISLVSLSVAYGVFYIVHYGTRVLGFIVINPIVVINLVGLIIGIFIQCIIASVFIRMLSAAHKFSVI